MAFLDETGLGELWELIKAEDAKVLNVANSKVQMAFVSYVGTGKYGANNPCSVTFDFVPKFVWLFGASSGCFVIRPETLSTSYQNSQGFYADGYSGDSYGKRSEDSKTISWYSTNSALAQKNTSGGTYTFVAFG